MNSLRASLVSFYTSMLGCISAARCDGIQPQLWICATGAGGSVASVRSPPRPAPSSTEEDDHDDHDRDHCNHRRHEPFRHGATRKLKQVEDLIVIAVIAATGIGS